MIRKCKTGFTAALLACSFAATAQDNFFNASTDNGRGVMPDREIPLEKFVSYIQATKDPELTYTFELIQSANRK
jgi:hypothetical protein